MSYEQDTIKEYGDLGFKIERVPGGWTVLVFDGLWNRDVLWFYHELENLTSTLSYEICWGIKDENK